MISRRVFVTAAAILADVLRIGDQEGGHKSLMEASGALDGFESRIKWVTFSAVVPAFDTSFSV